jgi:hypothetical protein
MKKEDEHEETLNERILRSAKEYAIENSTMRCKGDCEKCWINYSILSCEQRKIEDAYLSGAEFWENI